MQEVISSVSNPLVKDMAALKDKKAREKTGRMLVEGEVMILEAVKCGLQVECVLVEEGSDDSAYREKGLKTVVVKRHVLEKVADTRTPQGVIAAVKIPDSMSIEDWPDRIVALDGVQDPGNAGTIWRTADAAGLQGIVFGAGSCDARSQKVQRAAMGSAFRVPAGMSSDLAGDLRRLQEKGYRVVVSSLKGTDIYTCPRNTDKFVIVIGNEARGVSQAVHDVSDTWVKIPMRGGAESLNASVAAGILMYEWMRDVDGGENGK